MYKVTEEVSYGAYAGHVSSATGSSTWKALDALLDQSPCNGHISHRAQCQIADGLAMKGEASYMFTLFTIESERP